MRSRSAKAKPKPENNMLFLIICLILLMIVGLIVALLTVPVAVHIDVENQKIEGRVSVLGIPVLRYPQKIDPKDYKPSAKASKGKEKKTQKQNEETLSLPADADISALIAYVKQVLTELVSFVKDADVTLHSLQITSPKAEDAAEAALIYTAVSGGVAGALELLDQNTKLCIRHTDAIQLKPNFTNEDPRFHLSLTISFPPKRAVTAITALMEQMQKI